jgi:RimJ/RimL family protein N-acetyltransferase/catechol 2,3-dioxygenase-like lactoylglutathione lyase family enzyme
MTTIHTGRITLRPLSEQDIAALAAMFADDEPTAEPNDPDLTDPDAVAALVRRRLADAGPKGTGEWVLDIGGEAAGILQLRLRDGLLRCGWYVARAHRGTGVAAEAARAIVDHAHHTLGAPAVICLVREDNTRGRRFAERLGFVHAGSREHRGRPHRVYIGLPGPGGVHHVELWVADLPAAERTLGWLFTELGWREYQRWPRGVSWRHGHEYVVVEDSLDRRGERHDRVQPGLNHLALHVRDRAELDRITAAAPDHGWRLMFADRHPYAGGPDHVAAYLESDEGFEVELVSSEHDV